MYSLCFEHPHPGTFSHLTHREHSGFKNVGKINNDNNNHHNNNNSNKKNDKKEQQYKQNDLPV